MHDLKGIEMSEEFIDKNPEIKVYRKNDHNLIIEKTHATPTVHTESHSIAEAQAMIDKFDAVIALWEDKKIPYQAIIDKYNSLKV